MEKHVQHTCPWWLLFTFDNPLRKWIHDPVKILQPFVHPGDSTLDVGCGMGYFTLALADLTGKDGRVFAADLQPQMLAGLRRRAANAGLLDRIQLIRSTKSGIGIDTKVDFALAFWMVHEVKQTDAFLVEIAEHLRPGGKLLIVEPVIHVSAEDFDRTVILSQKIGFITAEKPSIRFSRAIVLMKPER